MNNLFDFLNLFGLDDNESTSILILLSGYYLIFSVGCLLNVLNIGTYMLSIYILSNEKILIKIPSKYVYIHKLIRFYKNIRIGFIIFEVLLLLFCLILMIFVSYGIVSLHFEYK